MEIYQLKYFVAVAKHENLHTAARDSKTSVGSLAKAVSGLEAELNVKLFQRVNRNIKLTEQGRILQKRALGILEQEESARFELSGAPGHFNIVLAGAEVLMAPCLAAIEKNIAKSVKNYTIHALNRDNSGTLASLANGEAHIGLMIGEPLQRTSSPLTYKKIFSSSFQTCVGQDHALYSRKGAIGVEEIMKLPFATISQNLFGPVDRYQSLDGWRDDKFPRKISYKVESLQILEWLVGSGKGIAYLPDYLVDHLGLKVLKVTGCPYTCHHDVYIAARNPDAHSFLRHVF